MKDPPVFSIKLQASCARDPVLQVLHPRGDVRSGSDSGAQIVRRLAKPLSYRYFLLRKLEPNPPHVCANAG